MKIMQTAEGELIVHHKYVSDERITNPNNHVTYFITLKGKFGFDEDSSPVGLWLNTKHIRVCI